MMSLAAAPAFRNGVRSGLTFGVLIVFLTLIGITPILSESIANMFDLNLDRRGPMEFAGGFLVYLAIFGLLAGAASARPEESQSMGSATMSGLMVGVTGGLISAIFAVMLSLLSNLEIDPRSYLVALQPNAVRLYTLELPPAQAGLPHLGILLLAGPLGAILRFVLGSARWRSSLTEWALSLGSKISTNGIISRLTESHYSTVIIVNIVAIALLVASQFMNNYWIFVLGTVGLYVLMGLGLNIGIGMAGLLDLGIVAFFAFGAYSVAALTAPAPLGLMWSFWVAMIVGVLIATIGGVLLGIPVLRLRGDYLAIVTLGLGEIISILVRSDITKGFTGGPQGISAVALPRIFGITFDGRYIFYLILAAIVLLIFLTIRLRESRIGRAWIAMREDQTVAQAMGINIIYYKLLAFAISAAFAGLSGAIFASRNQFTGPEDHTLLVSINVLAVVIVGGMNSIPGIILGAFALKGIPEILRQLDIYQVLAFGALLVTMMIFRPEGLWPSQRSRRVMEAQKGKPVLAVSPSTQHVEVGEPLESARGGQI